MRIAQPRGTTLRGRPHLHGRRVRIAAAHQAERAPVRRGVPHRCRRRGVGHRRVRLRHRRRRNRRGHRRRDGRRHDRGRRQGCRSRRRRRSGRRGHTGKGCGRRRARRKFGRAATRDKRERSGHDQQHAGLHRPDLPGAPLWPLPMPRRSARNDPMAPPKYRHPVARACAPRPLPASSSWPLRRSTRPRASTTSGPCRPPRASSTARSSPSSFCSSRSPRSCC